MSGLRADARRGRGAVALLAAALAFGGTADALAQAGPPLRLTPPPLVDREPAAPAQPLAQPDAPPAVGRPAESAPTPSPAIEIGRPAPIETDSVGLADPAQLQLPPNLWAGSSRDIVDPLIVSLPAASISRPGRDLARRLLVAAGTPPEEKTPPKASFVGRRAAKLLAMGNVEDAAALARLVPGREDDELLMRVLLDAALAGYDNAGACALTRTRLSRLNDLYWQKALIFCQALGGEHARAQLGLSLLREQNAPDDLAFTRLVGTLAGERGNIDKLPEPTPLHLAMMRAARQNLPADLATTNDPLLLRMIAATPNAPIEARLVAAERGEAFGAVSAETLAQAYESVSLTPEEIAGAFSLAESDRGPRGRAALYRAAKAQTVGVARAEALQRAWRLARERGGYATSVRVSLPLLAEIQPGSELSFFAVEAVRALLLAGKLDEARRWHAVIRAEAAAGNELAQTADALLWPLLWIADPDARNAATAPLAQRFESWRAVQQKLDAAAVRHRAPLVATLLFSSGERPDPAIVSPLLAGDLEREAVPMPGLGLWLGIGAALESGRMGEIALFALNLLGAQGPAGSAPHTMALVLDALRAAAFDTEARALALEAAIAAGL